MGRPGVHAQCCQKKRKTVVSPICDSRLLSSVYGLGKTSDVGGCLPQKFRTTRPPFQHHSQESQEVSKPKTQVPWSGDSVQDQKQHSSKMHCAPGTTCVSSSGTPRTSSWMRRASQGRIWVTSTSKGEDSKQTPTSWGVKWTSSFTRRPCWRCPPLGSWYDLLWEYPNSKMQKGQRRKISLDGVWGWDPFSGLHCKNW